MIKKYTLLILLTSIMALGISCAKKHDEADYTHKNISQAQSQNSKLTRKGLGRKEGGQGLARTDGISLTSEEKKAIEMKTVKTTLMPIKSNLVALGKVIAHQHKKAIVSYAFPARVSEIHIRIGDWVKSRQKLVTLQSEEVGIAKSEFYKAKADHELAKVSYERQKSLLDRGVGAKKDFLTREADFKVAEATLNAAEKKLHVLGFTEEQVRIISESHQINPIITLHAPLAGIIIQNNAILGGMVDQETEILVIMDPTVLWLDADIYEKDIARIKKGQDVEVTVPAYPGEIFMGTISYISNVLNEETRTLTVRTELENRDMRLKAGMFADIKIILNHQSKALVIPQQAILEDKGDKIVFIQRADRFFLQVVQVGAQENGFVEILKGLSEEDEIVTTGNFQLKSKLYEEILKAGHVH
ncbi:efflux RND transporter periplasmic adaptor subunit [Acidobacteriota bacterium]